MGTKVSYIVAVYNVGEYIERCARSLFEQSLEDLEIVFVNDASTDNSEAIIRKTLEDYPHRKGQVKILTHKTNKGIRDTRRWYATLCGIWSFVNALKPKFPMELWAMEKMYVMIQSIGG